jgi:hypothetical protein
MDVEHSAAVGHGAHANHIPLPRWFFFVKIAQLVLAVVILAVDAAAIAEFNSPGFTVGFSGSPNFVIFTVCSFYQPQSLYSQF